LGADIQRRFNRAVREYPLADLEARRPRHDRCGLLVLQIIDARATVALQGEDVAEAFGGDERGRESLALEYRVGRDR
jgi:hypothetical protein